jgi:hypothetical protein
MKAGHTTAAAALALCVLAGGCAPTVWYRAETSQAQFGVDDARCRLVAEGANPDAGVKTIHTGSYRRDLAANAAAGFLHGVAQGLAVRHTQELCMQANGYVAGAPGTPAAAAAAAAPVPLLPAVYAGPPAPSPVPIATAAAAPPVVYLPAPDVDEGMVTNRYHPSWTVGGSR